MESIWRSLIDLGRLRDDIFFNTTRTDYNKKEEVLSSTGLIQ